MDEEKKDTGIKCGDLWDKLEKLDKLDSLPNWTLEDYQNYRNMLFLLQSKINTLENNMNNIRRNAPGLLR